MTPKYDAELYNFLRQRYLNAKLVMRELVEDQAKLRKILKSLNGDHYGYQTVREMIHRNRTKLRKLNRHINCFYNFCKNYPELKHRD